jgi:predicted RNase H-like HicB family nuclease
MSTETGGKTRPFALQVTVVVSALVHPEPEAGGFSAEVPALQGCYTQGETMEEIETNLHEAIEGWLAVAHDEAVARTGGEGTRA